MSSFRKQQEKVTCFTHTHTHTFSHTGKPAVTLWPPLPTDKSAQKPSLGVFVFPWWIILVIWSLSTWVLLVPQRKAGLEHKFVFKTACSGEDVSWVCVCDYELCIFCLEMIQFLVAEHALKVSRCLNIWMCAVQIVYPHAGWGHKAGAYLSQGEIPISLCLCHVICINT